MRDNIKMKMNKEYNYACDQYDLENYDTAFEVFLRLAIQNDVDSQANVANMYLYGLGVGVNVEKAYYWYEKAAENNDRESQYWYALHLQEQKKFTEAFIWFNKSAIQGHTASQYYYGKYLFFGIGCKRNKVTALKNIQLSASKGDMDALVFLSHNCMRGRCGFIGFFKSFKWFYIASMNALQDIKEHPDKYH